MAYARKGNKSFDLTGGFVAECWWESTRYGFRHLAILRENGSTVARAKACYYNRTWERYQYESVLEKLVGDRPEQKAAVKAYQEPNAFGPMLGLMKLAELMCDKPEDALALKERTVFAMPGVIKPEDWDSLPVEVRGQRLEAIEKMLAE